MKIITSLLILFFSTFLSQMLAQEFDWQGHRGCRGLMPENSIPGFLKALEFDIQTLELDIVVSKDNELIISHEPWFSALICTMPDGAPVEGDSIHIIDRNYNEIKTFDCGSRGNTRFPDQLKTATYKPSLLDMVIAVEQYCVEHQRKKPFYNIEIKSTEAWYGKLTPQPATYVSLVIGKLRQLPIENRFNIQSFDINILKEVKKQAPEIVLAYLVENENTIQENIKALGFKPDIYSPYHLLLDAKKVKLLHKRKMKVIPWTVNDAVTMKKLILMGVDGIITDYPNLIAEVK